MPNRADISTRYHVFLGTHPSLLHSSFTPVLGKPHPDVLPGYHPVPASLPVPSSGAFNVVWGLADNFQRLLNSVLGSLLNSCFCDFPVPENFSMVVPRSRFTLVWLIQVCPQKGEAPSAGEALYYVLESMLQQCLPCLKLTWASSRPSILSWWPTGTLGGFRWCPGMVGTESSGPRVASAGLRGGPGLGGAAGQATHCELHLCSALGFWGLDSSCKCLLPSLQFS